MIFQRLRCVNFNSLSKVALKKISFWEVLVEDPIMNFREILKISLVNKLNDRTFFRFKGLKLIFNQ